MLRTEKPYPEIVRIESSPRVALVAQADAKLMGALASREGPCQRRRKKRAWKTKRRFPLSTGGDGGMFA